MVIQRILEHVPPPKVSEMEAGGGWIARRMLDGETDPAIIRLKVESAQQALGDREVLNSKGFVCPRPS